MIIKIRDKEYHIKARTMFSNFSKADIAVVASKIETNILTWFYESNDPNKPEDPDKPSLNKYLDSTEGIESRFVKDILDQKERRIILTGDYTPTEHEFLDNIAFNLSSLYKNIVREPAYKNCAKINYAHLKGCIENARR
jgi:hypothetical protein